MATSTARLLVLARSPVAGTCGGVCSVSSVGCSATGVWRARQSLHTSTSRSAVWFMAPLTRAVVAVGASMSRRLWKRLPADSRERIKSAVVKKRVWLYGVGSVGCVSGAMFYWSHVEVAPITHRRRFVMYTREEVRTLLESMLDEEKEEDSLIGVASLYVDGAGKILPSSDDRVKLIQSMVDNVITSNADWCDQADVSWRLTVVDDPTKVNAVSLPTGDIVVFSGMVYACHNLDELGLIVSHEMAHVLLSHGTESLSRTGLVDFLSLFAIAAIWLVVPYDVFSLITHKLFRSSTKLMFEKPYSRRLELEADHVGLMLASRACYNPAKAVKIWTHLPMYNESNRGLEYLQTHPHNERRHQELSRQLPHALDLYQPIKCAQPLCNSQQQLKVFNKIMHGLPPSPPSPVTSQP